jgi:hypothetical protein
MRWIAAAILALTLPSASLAEDLSKSAVDDLIAGLRDDDPARRAACEAELEKRGEEIEAEVKAAIEKETDAEARARLTALHPRLFRAVWLESLDGALARCRKDSRPLLIVRGDGPRGTPATAETVEGRYCREVLESEVVQEATRGYLAVWVEEKGVPGTPNASVKGVHQVEGYGGVEFWVVHPKLGLAHYLRGWWKAERFAAELERARTYAAAASMDLLRKLRSEAFEKLKTAFGESGCANADKHPEAWHCGGEGCVLRRLGLCYVQGDGALGHDFGKGLPDRRVGGAGSKLPF